MSLIVSNDGSILPNFNYNGAYYYVSSTENNGRSVWDSIDLIVSSKGGSRKKKRIDWKNHFK